MKKKSDSGMFSAEDKAYDSVRHGLKMERYCLVVLMGLCFLWLFAEILIAFPGIVNP